MLAMYLKYHKAGLTPITPVTSIAMCDIFPPCGRSRVLSLPYETYGKRNYISVLLLYNYNVFLNAIIYYALFLVLFAYQEALKFSFILSVIFWHLVMFLVLSNYIWLNLRTTERRKYVARDQLSLCCHLGVHCLQNLRIICQYGGVDGRKI